ncbi:hypothetical protein [Phaeobacter inhibens]|uniref:hypothetical protein n=1 Tax=Phaeobacter inhibens TaxID=221822 RepID=UPI000AF379E5|nr:hypothetical protein [Phaeobacter inhibens]WHP67300.1 hypothetical protein QMZ01_12190 [Phaeobacter inhibens]
MPHDSSLSLSKPRIYLCGPLQIISGDGTDATPRGKKSKAIIALVALSDNFSRSRVWLQDKLWSKSDSLQGAASLRQELSYLKKHFKKFNVDFLTIEREIVSIDLGRVETDFLEPAPHLHRSELLEGLDVNDPEFEDWLSMERQFFEKRFNETSQDNHLKKNYPLSNKAVASTLSAPNKNSGDHNYNPNGNRITVVVEPFKFASKTDRGEIFSLAIQEELLFLLGTLSDRIELRDARRQTGQVEGYLLSGSIIDAEEFRVSSQLVSTSNGLCILNKRWKFDDASPFNAIDKIAVSVIEGLQTSLQDGAWSNIWSSRSTPTEAWETFQRGRIQEARIAKESTTQAIRHFEDCLKIDPNFSPASVAIGFCILDRIRLGWSTNIDHEISQVSNICDQVEAINPGDPYCLALKAFLQNVRGETEEACSIMRSIVEDFPHSPELLGYYAGLRGYNDDLESEVKYYRHALTLTPHPPIWIETNLALSLALQGEKTAWYHANRVIEQDPRNVRARLVLCFLAHQCGNLNLSRRYAREVKVFQPDFSAHQWAYPNCFKNKLHYEVVLNALQTARL